MILGFHLSFGAFNAERAQILAQSHQRPLVEKAGEIVRAVGKQLAAPDSDEEVEKLALDLLSALALSAACARATCARPSGVASPRSLAMRPSVAASGVRASSMASSAYSCARAASTSSISAGCSPQGAGCKIVHATSITAATDNTRLVGTVEQLDTKSWEMLARHSGSITRPAA